MAQVPPLAALCLTAVGHSPRHAITVDTLKRAHRVLPAGKAESRDVKQRVLTMLEREGQLQDEQLADGFFHESMEALRVAHCGITDDTLTRIGRECPRLTSIDLSGCFEIWDGGVAALLRGCPALRRIALDNCRKLSDASLHCMVEHGGALRAISIGGCVNMTAAAACAQLVQRHPCRAHFQELHLSGLGMLGGSLRAIARECTALERLSIGFSEAADGDIEALAQGLQGLASLRVHWCERLTDSALLALHAHAKALTELNVSYNRGLSSAAIAQFCADMQLKEPPLHAVDCQFTSLEPQGVEFIAQHAPNLNLTLKPTH